MLKRYSIESNKIVETDSGQHQLLVYINPDENEKHYLINEHTIDEHTLNSAVDPDELSRLEFEPNHVALIYKRPKNYSGKDGLVFKVSSAGLFLFKDKLIVILPEDIPLFDGKPFVKVSSINEVMIKLIYRSIFHFLEHLRIINMISDELEKKINTSMENSYLINLFTLEKSLVYYLNSINSNGVLIDKLKLAGNKMGLSTDEFDFLDDMNIENNQCYRQAEIYSNILASLMDARASIVGNNLNVLMKTLNIITIAIMVPTFVVSAFSMNVTIPLQQHNFAFWIIMGLAGSSVAVVTYIWKRKKW